MSRRTVVPTFAGIAGFMVTVIELRPPVSASWPIPLLIACVVGGFAANAAYVLVFGGWAPRTGKPGGNSACDQNACERRQPSQAES